MFASSYDVCRLLGRLYVSTPDITNALCCSIRFALKVYIIIGIGSDGADIGY